MQTPQGHSQFYFLKGPQVADIPVWAIVMEREGHSRRHSLPFGVGWRNNAKICAGLIKSITYTIACLAHSTTAQRI